MVPTGGNQGGKAGGKTGQGFVPHSERSCFKCGGKGPIAIDCPGGANEVNPGPGGAGGAGGGEQPQGLGQPLPGAYSVEAPPEVTEETPEVREEWSKQYEERGRLNRSAQLGLSQSFHTCGAGCNHKSPKTIKPVSPSKAPVSVGPKSWFQKYAELSLVDMGSGIPEVSVVPKTEQDSGSEIISITVDSGAYNTVGPPKVGTHFKINPAEASATGRHYRATNGSVIRHYGQRVVTGRADEGTLVSMPTQVADVGKVLGSVREMVNHGNRVVFDKGPNGRSISYLECKATGVKTAIHERGGTSQFDIEVPKGKLGGGVGDVRGQEETRTEGFTGQGIFMADLFDQARRHP